MTLSSDFHGKALDPIRLDRDRFVALAFSAAEILFELASDGCIAYAAGATESLLKRPLHKIIGVSIFELTVPSERAVLRELMANARRGRRIDSAPLLFATTEGGSACFSVSGYQLPDLNGHYFFSLRRHTGKTLPRRPADIARDEVSGLPCDRDFVDMVAHHLTETSHKDDTQLTLITLPGFECLQKRLVETAEHHLFAVLGEHLRQASLGGDAAARLSTGRFSVLHDRELDLSRLEEDIANLTREVDPLKRGLDIETSTITLENDATDAAQAAQAISYAISHCGASKRSLEKFRASISLLAQEAIEAANNMQKIVAEADFDIVFQPIVNARTSVVHHYEALARFSDSYGFGSAYEHIAFAEATGVITDFDLAMARKAVDWLRQKTTMNSNVSIAVNLSGQSINSTPYLASIDRLLSENPWLRGRLLFEITESSRITELVSANNFIQRLRQQGIKVCLDDFGAGAANFQYLATLEVDIVKIDGLAIHNAQKAHKGKAFLKALVGLCHEIGVITVAEMIESDALLSFVRECGVHLVQGYLFGQPSPDIAAFKRKSPLLKARA
ncbi:MAG: EAL domain-containing protein [Rhodospirillales bacterium]|nr:EAL domain-containing protein [Rhodospirillales bacterium]